MLDAPDLAATFDVDRVRRDKYGHLRGELTVTCALPGARTVDGILSSADFVLSQTHARDALAKQLAAASRTPVAEWRTVLEELCLRVRRAERCGDPVVLLRDLPRPTPDEQLHVDGMPLLARHPLVIFGDGGAAKSYFALYVAGRLEKDFGLRVGLFDWELAADDHRDRLERLFGASLPAIRYARCSKPLIHELDRLRRIVQEESLQYCVFDSISFACDGPPEAAEVAGRYFQAVRQLGAIGSLHVAHVSKAEGADQKPFGSAFWHNGARATWFVKLAESTPGTRQIVIGLYNRKANLGALHSPIGFEVTFDENTTTFRRVQVSDNADLAAQLTVRQRMAIALRRGPMSPEALAAEIDADVDTVKRKARQYRQQFTVVPGGHLALLEGSR